MKRKLSLYLACLVAVVVPITLHSAEPNAAPAGKLVPAQLNGKIAAVDKTARTVAVEIQETVIKINVTDLVQITNKGKAAGIKDLAPGQNVSLSFLELPSGKLEVAALTINPGSKPLAAANR